MKKGLAIIGIASVAIILYFVFANTKKNEDDHAPAAAQTLSTGTNSDAFNQPFNAVLNSYFALHAALVDWDSTRANVFADSVRILLAKVPYDELQFADSSLQQIKNISESTAAEAEGFLAETNLESKRKSFYTLSENLYSLVKAVQYDQQVIYHDKCPMAFNDEEAAFWISNSPDIVNPYLGNKHPRYKSGMLHCGNIADSVDFRR